MYQFKSPYDDNMWKIKGDYPKFYKQVDNFLKNEQKGEKVWSNPRSLIHVTHRNPNYQWHNFEKVSIDDLIKNMDMGTIAPRETWNVKGKYDPKLFKYDSTKDKNFNNIIRATRKLDGSYTIEDGRHRLLALKNGGYTHAVIPIYDEFAHSNPMYKLMYDEPNYQNYPDFIRWIDRDLKNGKINKDFATKFKQKLYERESFLKFINELKERL